MEFIQAQYKYKCHMYDVYRMSNVEYPCPQKSYKDDHGNWILCDFRDSYLALVRPCGRVST